MAQQASGYHVDDGMFRISRRPMTSFANVEAEPELTASATNENLVQVKIMTGGSPLLITCAIRVKGWTGLFGAWLSNIQ